VGVLGPSASAYDADLGATYSLLAHRAVNPPPPSSLAEEEHLRSLLLRAAARDFRRSQRFVDLRAYGSTRIRQQPRFTRFRDSLHGLQPMQTACNPGERRFRPQRTAAETVQIKA
jgi:hypothetical protein